MMNALAQNLDNNKMAPPDDIHEFFSAQIESHLNQMLGTAMTLTRNKSDAEDLVAETVERAWTKLESLQERDRLLPWMLRIMTNLFISDKRRAINKTPHEQFEEHPSDDDKPFSLFERLHQPFLLWWGNPEQMFLNQILGEDITSALDELPEKYRIAVILSDIEGLCYQEIADALEVPIGTVRSRLARGRSILQQSLWKHAQDRGLVNKPEQEQ